MMSEYRQGSDLRDRTMAAQIIDITTNAASSGEQVNIMSLLGTSHAGIIKYLPETYQAENKIDIDGKVLGLGFMDEVNARLVTGEQISDELWENAFQEYKIAHTFVK